MDLATIKPSTAKLDIVNPGTGEETGLVLECTSLDSEAVKRVIRRQNDKQLKTGRNKPLKAEQVNENNIEIFAAAVVGWEWKGDAKWNGKKPECTPEIVKEVLAVDWIRRQIMEVIGDEAAFFSN